MKSIEQALSALSTFRDALINQLERKMAALQRVHSANVDFLESMDVSVESYMVADIERSRVEAIGDLHKTLNSKLKQLIKFAARESSGCPTYEADAEPWINEHAPLLSLRDEISQVASITYCTSTISDDDFAKAKALIESFDFAPLLQPILSTYTQDIAVKTVRKEAAKVLVDFFSLRHSPLSSVSKEHKAGYILNVNIYSSPNEYNFRSKKAREWGGAASRLVAAQKALSQVRSWSEDNVFSDIAITLALLRDGQHYDIYYDSREKFEAGACRLTMFNSKLELLMPKQALGQLVGFMRTYAADQLCDQKQAA